MLIYNVSSINRFPLSSTSKGNQAKWVCGDKFLKADSMGYESIAEVLATEVEMAIKGINFVDYSLCIINEDGRKYYGCSSDVFIKKGESLISIDRVLSRYAGSEKSKSLLLKGIVCNELVSRICDICSQLTMIPQYEIMNYFSQIVKLDALILNEDRHLNNITFIQGVDGGYRCSPIFDNGLSFLSDINDYPFSVDIPILVRKVKAKPFSSDFKKQIRYFADYDLLKLDIDKLYYRLENCMVDFKEKEFSRSVAVLKYRLSSLKGVVWE